MRNPQAAVPSRGLEGVIADVTAISSIDGERGELRYRGYAIADLVKHATFTQVVGLVLDGELPDASDATAITASLGRRGLPREAIDVMTQLPPTTHPMAVLQAALPLLAGPESRTLPRTRAAQRPLLLAIAARLPTLVAAWARVRAGLGAIPPDPALPPQADFLRMLTGAAPAPREVEILDVTQILQMEHGFNASTFTARSVASTQAPLTAALSAAVGALAGKLHGGADEAAYRMALAIGDPAAAPSHVDGCLERGERIMGLGHREYRVVDPRAVILRELALELAELKGQGDIVRTLMAVDAHAERRFAERGKRIRANVEFYKGAVFAAVGVPPDLFTCLFAMARVFGWGAHCLELWDDPRLYRPQALYVGAPPRAIAAR